MTIRSALIFLPFFLSSAATPTGELSLGGVVLNSHTGEPVKRALVQLTRFGRTQLDAPNEDGGGAGPLSRSVFTDSAGVFQFNALTPGHYVVTASKPEFAFKREDGGALNLDLSASKTDVQFKLEPLGVITGTVTDQNGQPIRGVNVM